VTSIENGGHAVSHYSGTTVDGDGRPSTLAYSGFNYFFSISKLRTTCKLQKQSFLASKNFNTLHGDSLLQNGQHHFWPNYQIPLDFELKIQETNQISNLLEF
jgi:hypothetical protein